MQRDKILNFLFSLKLLIKKLVGLSLDGVQGGFGVGGCGVGGGEAEKMSQLPFSFQKAALHSTIQLTIMIEKDDPWKTFILLYAYISCVTE